MISIIIIVKNDRGIEDTLKKLIKILKPEKNEILVIDASEGKLDYIKNKFPKVRWIYFHNKTDKKITIPEQRNLGIKKAKGNIIVFIDANCIPQKNWIINLIRPLIEEKENVVAGLVKSISKKSIHDQTWIKIKSKYLSECGAANLAFNKNIIKKIGYFDENFEAGEDIDFTWRIINKGYKIRYNKNAIVYHDWGNLKQEVKRAFGYGQARLRLYKKYPNKWKNLFGCDLNVITYPTYILLLPITFFWSYYPLFILIPLVKNIKRNPIKIVFLNLIYGLGVLKEFFPKTK